MTTEQLASFLACIQLGKSAKDCPAVKTDEDRQVFAELEKEAAEITAQGGELDIPTDGWI